jgi:anti-sigma regulatory factor (Ser/Thr protein kinase)
MDRGAVHVEERLPVTTGSPRLARRAAERAFAGAMPANRMDEVVLAISEVVTNAVRHAGMRPDEEILGSLDDDGDRIRIDVLDSGSGFLPWPADRTAAPDEGGHGLRLVDEVADAWGVEPGPPTRVWFEVGSATS